jgi:serine/threonine protein kinase
MDEVVLYKNLSELSITKEKKLSLLVIVLLEINFGNNSSLFNKIIEYLTSSKIIDCDITSNEYINARTKLFNLINDLNSSNTNLLMNTNIDEINNKDLVISKLNTYNKTFYELNLLGSGSFGNVYKVHHKLDNEYYAMKKIIITDELIQLNYDVFQEVKLFAKLHHPNIVRYFSSWIDFDINSILKFNLASDESEAITQNYPILFIQMELCNKTLKDYFENDIFEDSINTRINYWLKMVEGINYLHSNNIIHRDIKPSNIFFLNNEIKIGDFGMSKTLTNFLIQINKSVEIGTAYYRAPEIDSGNYDHKIDIYSLGIILFEMLLNCRTFSEKYASLKKIINTNIDNIDNILITNKYNQLILDIININPLLRPSCQEIINRINEVEKIK